MLDEFGVVAALQNLTYECIARWDKHIEFHYDVAFDRLEASLENAIYRIAQESLTNACQHSGSARIVLEIRQQQEQVRISCRIGGSASTTNGQREVLRLGRHPRRVCLLGGQITIASQSGQGSLVVVELPMAVQQDD